MLWSLLKMVLFFCVVAAITFGVSNLLNVDGGIRLSLGTMEYTLGPVQAVIAILLLLLAFWLLLKAVGFAVAMIRFLNGDETAISRYFDRSREKRGYAALNQALVALASGEGREALRGASRAERLLQKPELTNLIAAQAAEMAGDSKKAEEVYKALLTDDSTRFVGVRGIMKQRLLEGDTDTALKLAEKAFAIKPKHAEVQDTLLRLQADTGDWSGARKTLAAKRSSGSLPQDVHRRRDAVLALSEAKTLEDSTAAQDEFIEANRLSPDLVPAAVMAARTYVGRQQHRYATRILKKAWQAGPHPELAAAFAEIEPDETPTARINRFNALVRAKPDHPETKMMLAELHIAAEGFPAARRAIGDLAESDPSARALTIMAAIERGEGADDAVVRGWLTKALSAPRGPQWICDNCNTVQGHWDAVCGNCGALDTLTWRPPAAGEVAMPQSTEMLPLIVGAPADVPAVVEDAAPVDAAPVNADPVDAEVLDAEVTDETGRKE